MFFLTGGLIAASRFDVTGENYSVRFQQVRLTTVKGKKMLSTMRTTERRQEQDKFQQFKRRIRD
jgi:hypothetical protein